ncbi:MAG: N-6 DNA methylase [Ktedonobacteraceae bacterium]|nr:N-6 DNA methylase [Ktedonobacteraceae bacterium]
MYKSTLRGQQRAMTTHLKGLANHMALHAHALREALDDLLVREQDGLLSTYLRAFHASLLPTLTYAEFADMCTQTICYVLFVARLHTETDAHTDRTRIADLIPATDPLVRGLLEYIAAPGLHARIACMLEELLALIDGAELANDAHNAGQEPLIHFYEAFLTAYNPQVRTARGVYYTPEPVVSYIVRSVDALLKRDFGLSAGIADTHELHVLDPALGTGAFLHGIIDHVSASPRHNIQALQALLPRLAGYELLPAPYMIAHISLSLKLTAMGYDLRTDAGELRVYLTNALEATQPGQQEARVQVVLGNPPYANSGMLNKNAWIQSLLAEYKRDLHEQKLNLDDDCIKFIRLGQWRIQQAGSGILAFITNRTYLEGITHRRMRQSLLETFSAIYILDLHGGYRERPLANDPMKDENVFDIQQGVAIGIFVRKPEHVPGMAAVYHADLWGSRASKYARLTASDLATTPWTRLEPQEAHYFFVPQQFERRSEWQAWIPLTGIFPVFSTGIKTHLDAVLVGETDAQVARQVDGFVEMYGRDDPALPTRRGSASHKAALLTRELLAHPDRDLYRDYAYRPFDIRRIAYQPAAIEAGDHRFPVMRHALSGSMLLATTRQLSQNAFSHVFVSTTLTDMCLLSTATRECAYCFPLYLYTTSLECAASG